MDQILELSVWLGMAGVALIWANLVLWRTRHVLHRLRQNDGVPEGRPVPSASTQVASSVAAP